MFTARAQFRNAILERPTASRVKDCSAVFDAEKLLFSGNDRTRSCAKNKASRVKKTIETESPKIQLTSSRFEMNRFKALQILRLKNLLSGKSLKRPQTSELETVVTLESSSVATPKKKDRTCALSRKVNKDRTRALSTFETAATDNLSYVFGGSSVEDAIVELPIIEDHDDVVNNNVR